MGPFPSLLQTHVQSRLSNGMWCPFLDHFGAKLNKSFCRILRLVHNSVDLEIMVFVLWVPPMV